MRMYKLENDFIMPPTSAWIEEDYKTVERIEKAREESLETKRKIEDHIGDYSTAISQLEVN